MGRRLEALMTTKIEHKENTIMVTKKGNRTSHQVADEKLIDGVKKHEQTLGGLLIGGVSYKPADITPVLQARVDSANRVLAARAAWAEAVQADRDEQAKSKTFVSGLRQALKVAFGKSVETLADFGLTPRKQAVVTPAQRVAATAKGQATRAARHTMGPKQKAKIKGAVAPTAPATSPAAPAPVVPPLPAPTPGAAGGTTPHGT
jgi:hypothetical protein